MSPPPPRGGGAADSTGDYLTAAIEPSGKYRPLAIHLNDRDEEQMVTMTFAKVAELVDGLAAERISVSSVVGQHLLAYPSQSIDVGRWGGACAIPSTWTARQSRSRRWIERRSPGFVFRLPCLFLG